MPGTAPVPVYLFRWRRAPDFDAEADAFAACLADAEGRNPDATVSSSEHSPWRAYGLGWSDELRDTVDVAITSP
jgi:hypothetical protein